MDCHPIHANALNPASASHHNLVAEIGDEFAFNLRPCQYGCRDEEMEAAVGVLDKLDGIPMAFEAKGSDDVVGGGLGGNAHLAGLLVGDCWF